MLGAGSWVESSYLKGSMFVSYLQSDYPKDQNDIQNSISPTCLSWFCDLKLSIDYLSNDTFKYFRDQYFTLKIKNMPQNPSEDKEQNKTLRHGLQNSASELLWMAQSGLRGQFLGCPCPSHPCLFLSPSHRSMHNSTDAAQLRDRAQRPQEPLTRKPTAPAALS